MPILLNKPLFLTLWLLIPFIWIMMRRSSGPVAWSTPKKITATIRTLLIIVLGLALSEPQLLHHSDQVNVVFCLDVSESIYEDQRRAAETFVKRAAAAMQNSDQAGLVVFGRQATLEISLRKDFDFQVLRSEVNQNYTNIYDALQLAIGNFPQQGKNKILIFSDGNENIANSRDMSYLARSLGIEIYPVPLATWFGKNEAYVKTLSTPPRVTLETPFEIRLVVISSIKKQADLVLIKNGKLLFQESKELKSGTNVFTFTDALAEPGLYLYKAVVNFSEDAFFQNNEGLAFTTGTQKARILYLTDQARPATYLVEALKTQGLAVDDQHIKHMPASFHGFVDYNAIILDNVSGRSLSYSTMEQIEKYVKETGGGLIMIGGDTSFGAGFYKNTPIEKILPVDMDAPTDIELSELYLIFVIDKSSSMTSSYKKKSKLEIAKIAAFSSIEMLNPIDSVGIVTFDTEFDWTVPLTRARARQKIAANLSRITEGGGTDLYPALKDVHRVLNQVSAVKKHVIILSDGETEEADFKALVQSMGASNISISTVSIGQGSNINLMKSIAEWGRGRAYYTDDPNSIPQIFTGETKIISKKIITEKTMQPIVNTANELLQGISDTALPVIFGQVVTYPKSGADLLLKTTQGPLLAAWQYGLGRSVAFTSDLSGRWGKDWVNWEHYGRFASQMVKWVQRKESNQRFFASIKRSDENGTFTVDVTTEQKRFVNHLDLKANLLLPSGKNRILAMAQIAPGRYACSFPAEEIGAYFFSVYSDSNDYLATPRTFGFGIPYTEEFNRTAVNEKLLAHLAATSKGQVLSLDTNPADLFKDASNSKASGTSLWSYLIILFLLLLTADVAVRKFLDVDGSLSFQ